MKTACRDATCLLLSWLSLYIPRASQVVCLLDAPIVHTYNVHVHVLYCFAAGHVLPARVH